MFGPHIEDNILTLIMIVKDEARSIAATLESVAESIQELVIVDTGSTDGTLEIIDEFLKKHQDIRGFVEHHPFIDFATTRNLSLQLAREKTNSTFGLVLSGDETLIDTKKSLLQFCARMQNENPYGAYNVAIEYGGSKFDSPRLVRLDGGWRYVGVVHEVLMKENTPPASIRVPDVSILHTGADTDRKRLRLYKDLEMLREQIRKTPKEARLQFYMAKTLEELGFLAQAFEAYRRRVDMGGWIEEKYEAAYKMGFCSNLQGKSWADTQQLYLDAHSIDPRRAEPLCAIAQRWYGIGNFPLCWLFASRAASIPYPADCVLFVQQDVYVWKAADLAGVSGFHVGQYARGFEFAKKAAAACPNDESIRKHMALYDGRL